MKREKIVLLAVAAAFVAFIMASFNLMAEPEGVHVPPEMKGVAFAGGGADDPILQGLAKLKPGTPLVNQAQGVYGSGPNRSVLWFGVLRNNDQAQGYAADLASALRDDRDFSPVGSSSPGGQIKVYLYQGKGLYNHVYAYQNMVFWVGTASQDHMAVLEWALRHPFRRGGY